MFPGASKSCLEANPPRLTQTHKDIIADVTGREVGVKRPKMTKTEQRFGDLLEARKKRGEVISYQFHGITIRWGNPVRRYTPDFFSIEPMSEGVPHRICLYEIKGSFIFPNAKRRFLEAKDNCHWAQCEMWQWNGGKFERIL